MKKRSILRKAFSGYLLVIMMLAVIIPVLVFSTVRSRFTDVTLESRAQVQILVGDRTVQQKKDFRGASMVIEEDDAINLKCYSIDIPRMSDVVCEMLEIAIRVFIENDEDTAREIPARDVEIDMLYDQVQRVLLTFIMDSPGRIESSLMLFRVVHNIERAGDRVVNICERIIFNITGEVVDFD